MYPLKLLGLLGAIGLTLAQDDNTPAQCAKDAQFTWMYNSLSQDPCTVASYLGGVCTNGAFHIPPLNSGEEYIGPTKIAANNCRCSSVFFTLISACAVCQFAQTTQWSAYYGNCSSISVSAFIEPIPKGTAVPYWAYMNVTQTNGFNASVAAALGDQPETTPSSSSSSVSSTSTGTATPSSSHNSSKAGPIAGGVVGGLVFIALVSVIVFYFVRQNQKKKAYPTPNVTTLQPGETLAEVKPLMNYPIPPPEPTPLLYNPNDPSTFPATPPPVLGTTNMPGIVNPLITGSSFSTTPTATAGPYYPGVAEV